MSAIETTNLTKKYGNVQAVRDLDLRVGRGEIFGFLGPNGAGKSTTINILLDFVRPTSGQASVLGMDCQAESKRVRSRIGVLPEGYDTYSRLTGRQHLEFAIDSKGVDADPDRLLSRVGLDGDGGRKAGEYSKGMSQRLTLAMALVGDPDLLILDEPTTGLDPNGAREVREVIREENSRGTTVFFSSHILGQVEAVCDRVGILQNGELVADDSVEGLQNAVRGGGTLVVEGDGFTDDVVRQVESLAGVGSVEVRDPGRVIALGLDTDARKTEILADIESTGATVSDFETEETSLEDVFQAYTTGGVSA